MKIKPILVIIGLVLLGQSAVAEYNWSRASSGYSNPFYQQYEKAPAQVLKSKMDKLLLFLKHKKELSDGQMRYFLSTEVAPVFDFDYMTKMAVGRNFTEMEAMRRDAMVMALTERFMKTMIARLTSYDNQRVRYLLQRFGRDGRTATVGVAITGNRGYPARLDFRFYLSDKGWQVYDVLANGQSAVVHYRTQFRKMNR